MTTNNSSTPKNRKRRFGSRGFWIALAIVLACPVVFIGAVFLDPGPHPSLQKIGSYASVKFPESARLVNSHGRSFLEIHIFAKVEMDRAEVDQFISSLPEPREAMDADEIALRCHGFFDWWNPGSLKRCRGIEITHDNPSGKSRRWTVLVGLDDPHKAVVYLHYGKW